uniref:Uncharacterized protein n=1 Tax=Dunaliella tertiolecta TaxID=3047 RepID=A0A7S3R5W8_DUNTE|mmetsp:Transcript_8707/g.23402  ORF Transcript_8707/g.23402 Transcript_8707/m.23402 type:complete len:146 (+) Transcript_8707:218-655(+)
MRAMQQESSTTSSAEMGDDDLSSQEKEVCQQEVGKRMRQSRTRKHKQLRKRDISARPAAGLPIAHPHPARRSARLRPSGLSCTAGAGEHELQRCLQLLDQLPQRSSYAQHRRRCVQKAIDLLSRKDRTDTQAQELSGLLHQLQLR